MVDALVPIALAACLADLSGVAWAALRAAVALIAVASTFLGVFVAVSVSEVFEAQTFSNFIRFPMIFLCGPFLPVSDLPALLQPLSYVLPLTYGVDILRGSMHKANAMPLGLDFAALGAFCVILFLASVSIIHGSWIA
jgi:ABC-2 type transport system permease protein